MIVQASRVRSSVGFSQADMSDTVETQDTQVAISPAKNGRWRERIVRALSERPFLTSTLSVQRTALIYLVIRVLVNAIALVVAIIVTPGVRVVPNPQVPITLTLLALGLVFGLVNTLIRPVLLLLTGRLIVKTMGLFLVVNQALLFLIVQWLFHPFEFDSPEILWVTLASLVMAGVVVLLEATFGLDTPMIANDNEGRFYWRWLGLLPTGQRNSITENLRLGQILDTVGRYTKNIAIQQTPLAQIRIYMQDILYGDQGTISSLTTPVKVRLMAQELGPTFVKFGQIVSSRPEVVTPEWRVELEKLQSNVPPFSYQTARRIIQEELHKPPEELYASFDNEAFAAASTAQVHKATLTDGTDVVVKVQRPDIDVTVRADLNVMRDLAKQIQHSQDWAQNLDVRGLMDEFAENVIKELDYHNEAYNARTLAYNMKDIPGVHVPVIYPELSATKVLTMEYVKGVKITKLQALDDAGVDRKLLARTFLRAMIKQILIDRFFHGDPHPGNIMVDLETSTIIFLDMGMMGELTKDKRQALIELIWALKEQDAFGLAKTFRKLSSPFKPVNEALYMDRMERYVSRFFADQDQVSSLSEVLSGSMAILTDSGLRLDKNLTLGLKAIIQAEEVVTTLNPNLDDEGGLVNMAFNTVTDYMSAQLNPDNIMNTVRLEVNRSARELVGRVPTLAEATTKWLEQYEKGRLSVHLDTSDLQGQLETTQRALGQAVNRLVVGLVLAGVLIGSAIATGIQQVVMGIPLSNIAFYLFVGGAFLAGVLIIRYLASGSDDNS
jgi:ubiquinone biosynthesis protein